MRFLTVFIYTLLIYTNYSYSYQEDKNLSTIEGYVYDLETNAPLIGASVYISNSLLGCGSDKDGSYKIHNIPPGIYHLVASYVGYELKTQKIVVEANESYERKIYLKQKVHELEEVVISGELPKDWKKNLKKFTEEFLGVSKNANLCKIVNPEVLSFQYDKNSGTFKANAEDMIKIENRALGYMLQVSLIEFTMREGLIKFKIEPQFKELEPKNDKEYDSWTERRYETYRGSIRHFLSSLIRHELNDSGFEIERTDAPPPDDYFSFDATEDSLFVYNKDHDHFELNFEGFLKVSFLPGKSVSISRPYIHEFYNKSSEAFKNKRIQIPTSGIIIKDHPVLFSYNGFLYDSYKIDQYGTWSLYRIADFLPLEYLPDRN